MRKHVVAVERLQVTDALIQSRSSLQRSQLAASTLLCPLVEVDPCLSGGHFDLARLLIAQRIPGLVHDLRVHDMFNGGPQLIERVRGQPRNGLGKGNHTGHCHAFVGSGHHVCQVQRAVFGVAENDMPSASDQPICVREAVHDMLLMIWEPGVAIHDDERSYVGEARMTHLPANAGLAGDQLAPESVNKWSSFRLPWPASRSNDRRTAHP